jgi:hypothetical protein
MDQSMPPKVQQLVETAHSRTCPSPISRPAKTIDLGMVSDRATRDTAHRSDPRCDPIRVVDSPRPPVRNACPTPPIGCPEAFESALSTVRPAAVADLATGVAAVARRAGAGPAGDRRSVAPRSVYSPLVGAVREVLDDHASICCVAISLGAWLRRIGCGVRREFTANCSSSQSSCQNAPCRVTCETGRRDRHRPGAHLS